MKILISHIDLDGFGVNVIEKIYNKYLGFDKVFNFNYGFEEQPEIQPYINKNNEIIMVDLSIPETYYTSWKNDLKSFIIIDHHESSSYLSKYLENIWSTERSGTWLFWNNYVKKIIPQETIIEKVNYFVNLVDCYDRWQEDSNLWLSATRLNKVSGGMGSLFIDHIVNKLLIPWEWTSKEESLFQKIEEEEDSILNNIESNLELRKDNKGYTFILMELKDKSKLSMVCSKLLHKHNEIDYIISCQPSGNKLSFRTRKDIDLTKLHGVNGHKQAAGATIGKGQIWKLILPNYCLRWVEDGTRKSSEILVDEVCSSEK